MKKNETIIDDDGNTYEVLVISEDSVQKPTIETEFEEFELLEVDNVFDANTEIIENIKIKQPQNERTYGEWSEKINSENQTIEFMETGNIENENDKNSAIVSIRTRQQSRRKSKITTKNDTECEIQNVGRTTRQTVKMKNEVKKPVQNLKNNRKTSTSSIKSENHVKLNAKENCDIENRHQDYDGIEGESDDEFPARDSDNEDWPSQETLNEFPKQIIKDGLLQVKGKDLMTLICR